MSRDYKQTRFGTLCDAPASVRGSPQDEEATPYFFFSRSSCVACFSFLSRERCTPRRFLDRGRNAELVPHPPNKACITRSRVVVDMVYRQAAINSNQSSYDSSTSSTCLARTLLAKKDTDAGIIMMLGRAYLALSPKWQRWLLEDSFGSWERTGYNRH